MQNKLKFTINSDANRIVWKAEGTPLKNREESDFWRLMADDGYLLDMQVKSSQQKGMVSKKGNVTTITYDRLVTDTGKWLDIALTLTITELEDRLLFDSKIDNHDPKTRADELEYPYIELTQLCGERENDILIRPKGLGEKIKNPWVWAESAHTEYRSSDYKEIKASLTYPKATMSWFGLQSGKNFLYLGRHDHRPRVCAMLTSIQPREMRDTPYMASAICQYPFVRPDEEQTLPQVVVTLAEGDWRIGSDIYGEHIRSTFYTPIEHREWVKHMTGWQRIILRHQYGEIFWKYEDLPRLYLEGKESGIDTLLVFGWWKGRFDNGYPKYEFDDELGGEQALRDAIAEIQSMGGRVILYNNGILIDKKSDFYQKHHTEAAKIDIDGNEYEDHYMFENNGTLLRNYGYKSFVDACQASTAWRDIMMKNAMQKAALFPDSVFFDQLGGRCELCFNPEHRHGYRPDDELFYRRQNIKEIRDSLPEGMAFGTEVTNDATACMVDYIHGSDYGTSYNLGERGYLPERQLPEMFRRTCPEIILSNRHTHDCFRNFKDQLNHAFIYGLRFDVSIYRGRVIGIKGLPEYAEYIKKLIDIREKFHNFFYLGKFVCNTALTLPEGVKYGEYEYEGQRMFALWNQSDKALTLDICGKPITIAPKDVDCIIA